MKSELVVYPREFHAANAADGLFYVWLRFGRHDVVLNPFVGNAFILILMAFMLLRLRMLLRMRRMNEGLGYWGSRIQRLLQEGH